MKNLSVVIPCYNSARHLEKRVREIEGVLKETRWSWEIVLCDDGSRDDTPQICQRLAEDITECRYIPSSVNRGRGRNVSEGIIQCEGDIVGFLDADFSTAAIYIIPVVQAIRSGYDVAEANRTYKIVLWQLPFIFHRVLAHIWYAKLVAFLLGLKNHDTASGFKFFKHSSYLKLAKVVHSDSWFWDTEVIGQSHALGMTVCEIQSLFVRTKGMGSTVRFFKDSWSLFWAVFHFWRRMRNVEIRKNCCG